MNWHDQALAVMTRKVNTPSAPLKHLFCMCQISLPERDAFCGRKLGPAVFNRLELKPIEVCVLCTDVAESGDRICPFCGKLSQ